MAPLIALLWTAPQHAQADNTAELWLRAGVRYEPIKKIRLSFDQHLRFDDNLSRISAVMPEIEVAYRPVRVFSLALGYRLQIESQKNGFDDAHRIHLDAKLRGRLGRLQPAYRLRFQERFRRSKGELKTAHKLRNRVSLAVDTDTAATPRIYSELFTSLADTKPFKLTAIRFGADVAVRMGDNSLVVGYVLIVPIEKRSDPNAHAIRIGYRYRIRSNR